MPQKAGRAADEYGLRIVGRIRDAIERSGRSNESVMREAGLKPNYFYIRMRGERPFTTDDVVAIARALRLDLLELFSDRVAPSSASQEELQRQIRASAEAALLDQLGGPGSLSDCALAEMSDAAMVELTDAIASRRRAVTIV